LEAATATRSGATVQCLFFKIAEAVPTPTATPKGIGFGQIEPFWHRRA
jgi:hypothetical protein